MKTTVKLIVLITIAATAMMALTWVNQQHVRDIGSRRAPVNQSGF